MGLEDEARRMRQQQDAAANRKTALEVENMRAFNKMVDDFVRLANRLGIPLETRTKMFRASTSSWRFVETIGSGALAATETLVIRPDGSWDITFYDPDAYVSNNKPRITHSINDRAPFAIDREKWYGLLAKRASEYM